MLTDLKFHCYFRIYNSTLYFHNNYLNIDISFILNYFVAYKTTLHSLAFEYYVIGDRKWLKYMTFNDKCTEQKWPKFYIEGGIIYILYKY
jgi:hypothetical protein